MTNAIKTEDHVYLYENYFQLLPIIRSVVIPTILAFGAKKPTSPANLFKVYEYHRYYTINALTRTICN